jgi:hypothetical protein
MSRVCDANYRIDQSLSFAPGDPLSVPTTSRFPSPALKGPSRVPSPALKGPVGESEKAVAKKKPAAKTAEDLAVQEKLQWDIEIVIEHFKPEYNKHKIECEDERDLKSVEDKEELYKVAQWLNVNKPVPRKFDLAKFSSKQIRKFAVNCGIRGGGNLTLFQCWRKIAVSITMGTVYDDDTIANPKTTTTERKVNTLMRIINACFHSEMKDKFIDLNDPKKCIDYEKAHGKSPVKDFWVALSEFTNNSTRNVVLGTVLYTREGEDEHGHLGEWVADGEFNLNDFTLQMYLSSQQHMCDVMKAMEICLKQLRASGHHNNDMYGYATNTDFTKLRKNGTPVPAQAIYYCHILCQYHPEVLGKFAPFLNDQLKSDSAVDLLTGSADSKDDTRSDKKNKALDSLVNKLEKLCGIPMEQSVTIGINCRHSKWSCYYGCNSWN